MKTTQELHAEIEDFLKRHNMSPTAFGTDSVADHKVVNRFREGKTVTLVTAEQLRDFMKRWEREHGKASDYEK